MTFAVFVLSMSVVVLAGALCAARRNGRYWRRLARETAEELDAERREHLQHVRQWEAQLADLQQQTRRDLH